MNRIGTTTIALIVFNEMFVILFCFFFFAEKVLETVFGLIPSKSILGLAFKFVAKVITRSPLVSIKSLITYRGTPSNATSFSEQNAYLSVYLLSLDSRLHIRPGS